MQDNQIITKTNVEAFISKTLDTIDNGLTAIISSEYEAYKTEFDTILVSDDYDTYEFTRAGFIKALRGGRALDDADLDKLARNGIISL